MASFLNGSPRPLAAACVLGLIVCSIAACDSAPSGSSTGAAGSGATGGTGGTGGSTTTTTIEGGGGSGGETTSSTSAGGGGSGGATGGSGPTADALFVPNGLARIDLTFTPLALELLAAAPSEYVHADAEITLASGEKVDVPDIGARLKGVYGSFRTMDQKAAFLLHFNQYHKKQKPLGLEKLAVNNMVQDPSMIHEQLAYELFRSVDVPAPRSSYARVYVNGELYGLYATVEVLDNSELLTTWFGDDQGSLYEGQYGSDLEDGLIVTFDQDNGADVGFQDLQDLKVALDGMTDPATFYTQASVVIDMDRYVNFAATEIFIGHWDGYAWTRNNYFLYRGPDSRWTWLPWGTDQTFNDALNIWGGGGRLEQMCGNSLPCRQKLKTAYELVSSKVGSLGLVARCDEIQALIGPAVQEDPRKEYDSFTVYSQIQAVKDFLTYRVGDVANQLPCADPSVLDNDGDGASGCGLDCDDNNPDVYPGGPEICNLTDDNCDGQVDEDPMCPGCVNVPAAGGGTLAFCFKARPWPDAEADCVAQGGHLASIHDDTQQSEIVSGAYSVAGGEWWIGLNDEVSESLFVWTDGTPVDFTSWNGGEPNNSGNEDCTHLASWAGGLWNDMPCEAQANYVCRLP